MYRALLTHIITLQQVYETFGDAEAYGLCMLLASQTGVASVVLLSEGFNILVRMNATVAMKIAHFTNLPVFLKLTTDLLDHLKEEHSKRMSLVELTISLLEEEHRIPLYL